VGAGIGSLFGGGGGFGESFLGCGETEGGRGVSPISSTGFPFIKRLIII